MQWSKRQDLVGDDELALIQSSHDARIELEELFNADQGEGVLGDIARRASDIRPA